MDVLRDQAVLELSMANEKRLRQQAQAARDRFDVGEVTKTDVAQAEARMSRVISERVSAEGALGVSKAIFKRVTGIEPLNLGKVETLSDLNLTLDDAIKLALIKNPSIIQAQNQESVAKSALKIAMGTLKPTITLSGSYSTSYNASALNYQSDTAQVSAQLSMPLYQAGAASSRIRQAKHTVYQRKTQVEEQKKTVIANVTSSWVALKSSTDRIRSNIDQVSAAEVALEGVIQEAEAGSRTTLDVLDAEQELLDAQVALVRSERDEYVASFDLRVAIGLLLADELKLPVELYDPQENYRNVEGKLYGSKIKK